MTIRTFKDTVDAYDQSEVTVRDTNQHHINRPGEQIGYCGKPSNMDHVMHEQVAAGNMYAVAIWNLIHNGSFFETALCGGDFLIAYDLVDLVPIGSGVSRHTDSVVRVRRFPKQTDRVVRLSHSKGAVSASGDVVGVG